MYIIFFNERMDHYILKRRHTQMVDKYCVDTLICGFNPFSTASNHSLTLSHVQNQFLVITIHIL